LSGSGHQQIVSIVDPKFGLVAFIFMLLAILLSGYALGMVSQIRDTQQTAYAELEREVRLLQLNVDNMKVALLARGIDPAPHLEGESP
jgi:hypothetical protein